MAEMNTQPIVKLRGTDTTTMAVLRQFLLVNNCPCESEASRPEDGPDTHLEIVVDESDPERRMEGVAIGTALRRMFVDRNWSYDVTFKGAGSFRRAIEGAPRVVVRGPMPIKTFAPGLAADKPVVAVIGPPQEPPP